MRKIGAALVILTFVIVVLAAVPLVAQDWPMFGKDVTNNATTAETSISPENVGSLAPKWVFKTVGDVSARASVADDVVYFPDWKGNLYALKANTGQVVWSHTLRTMEWPQARCRGPAPPL